MPTVYTEKTSTTTAAYILYTENLVDDWRELLAACPYQFVLSPIHRPAEKKEHYHIMIYSGKSSNFLSFDKVETFVESVCKNHAHGIVVYGSLDARKEMARYFIHMENPAKEQFDLRSGDAIVFDDTGRCTDSGLTSIYSPAFGYADKGMNFINLITLTKREESKKISSEKTEKLSKVLDFIYDNFVSNFADVVKWARLNDCLDAIISYCPIIRGVCADMKQSDYFRQAVTVPEEIANESCKEIEREYEEKTTADADCPQSSEQCYLYEYNCARFMLARYLHYCTEIIYTVRQLNAFASLHSYELCQADDTAPERIYWLSEFKNYVNEGVKI